MSFFDTWSSRISNLLGIIGFNWKSDPLVGSIAGLVMAYWAYLETLSLREMLMAFLLGLAAVMVIAVAGRLLWRLFRGGGAPSTPSQPVAPSGQGGGHSAPVLTARDNSKIQYTYNDNRILVLQQRDGDGTVDAKVTALSAGIENGKLVLYNAANVTSAAVSSYGVVDILFRKPIDPKHLVTDVRSGSTRVASVSSTTATVNYDETLTKVLDITFKSTK